MITCKYCKYWRKTPVLDRRHSVYIKKCPVLKSKVASNTEICDDFVLNEIFICLNEQNRLHILACINRQEKNQPCSLRCRQKDVISVLYNVYGDEL